MTITKMAAQNSPMSWMQMSRTPPCQNPQTTSPLQSSHLGATEVQNVFHRGSNVQSIESNFLQANQIASFGWVFWSLNHFAHKKVNSMENPFLTEMQNNLHGCKLCDKKKHCVQCRLIDQCPQSVFFHNRFLVRKLAFSHKKFRFFGFTRVVWGEKESQR